jgi:hypothetical protein
MSFYGLLLGVLAVWRVTHLLNAEDGPWDLVVRLRQRVGDGFFGRLLDCFYCLSLWVAAPFAVLLGGAASEVVLLWLAMSGGAALLERATGGFDLPAPLEPVYRPEDFQRPEWFQGGNGSDLMSPPEEAATRIPDPNSGGNRR